MVSKALPRQDTVWINEIPGDDYKVEFFDDTQHLHIRIVDLDGAVQLGVSAVRNGKTVAGPKNIIATVRAFCEQAPKIKGTGW